MLVELNNWERAAIVQKLRGEPTTINATEARALAERLAAPSQTQIRRARSKQGQQRVNREQQ